MYDSKTYFIKMYSIAEKRTKNNVASNLKNSEEKNVSIFNAHRGQSPFLSNLTVIVSARSLCVLKMSPCQADAYV